MLPNDYARQVLRQCWNYALPLNPVELANKLGVQIYSSPDLGELSGYYDEEKRHIVVNANDGLLRQRFTVAHELGHHVMGHGSSPRDSTQKYSQRHYVPKEYEANAFAAELLMPEEAVRTMIEQRGLSFDQLLGTFLVSPEAMRIRLERLGYI